MPPPASAESADKHATSRLFLLILQATIAVPEAPIICLCAIFQRVGPSDFVWAVAAMAGGAPASLPAG